MTRYSFFILCILLGLLPVMAADPGGIARAGEGWGDR